MDRSKFSTIAHRQLDICNPLSGERLSQAVERIAPNAEHRVADFGAGKGEFLIRLVERYGVKATAIEILEVCVAEMRRRIDGRIAAERLRIICGDAREFVRNENEHFDLALCIGATHAFGNYAATLDALGSCVRPGGWILVGEGFWKQKPDPEYLAFLEGGEDELNTHAGNVAEAESRGLVPLFATTASTDEFDAYEWAYSTGIESYVADHPNDPDAPAMLERIRRWRRGYLQWGRDTLGFGLYLLQTPPKS